MNTVAILFIFEVDNAMFAVGTAERVRARVEAAGRVEIGDDEAEMAPCCWCDGRSPRRSSHLGMGQPAKEGAGVRRCLAHDLYRMRGSKRCRGVMGKQSVEGSQLSCSVAQYQAGVSAERTGRECRDDNVGNRLQ
jgi:hypothetical protein